MRTIGVNLLAGLLLCPLAWRAATAQNSDAHFSGQLPTPADWLHAKGVGTSETDLIAALRNNDPAIRSTAANELANQHDSAAIPLIESALSDERDPEAQVGIAQALFVLNDPKGLAHLQSMCSDASLDINVIAEVVGSLRAIRQSSAPCAGLILHYLDSHSDSDSRTRLLGALTEMYQWTRPPQAQQIAGQLQNMLGDSDPTVRMQASDALAQIDLQSSADLLRAAIARENDPVARMHLQRSLDRLEKKK